VGYVANTITHTDDNTINVINNLATNNTINEVVDSDLDS